MAKQQKNKKKITGVERTQAQLDGMISGMGAGKGFSGAHRTHNRETRFQRTMEEKSIQRQRWTE